VRDRDQRLQRLFTQQPSQAMVQARRILDESARYNLGSLRRNINIPTMALTYLKAANQPRSAFTVSGREKVNGVETNVLAFREQALPTVIRADARNLPATGRFWVDPDTGRIVKSELSVLGEKSKSKITVTYAPAPKLAIWTPVTMKEEYTTSTHELITCEAKYSNFRQFTVAVNEDLNAPEYVKIGNAQMQSKDYKGAETAFRRAIELDPTLAGAHAALGSLLATTNRRTDAIDAWKHAVELDPNQFDALFTLTRALADAKRLDEARTYGQRFIATAPADQYKQNISIIRKLLDGIKS
jgi:tetratricopeptide (TPR) repeat protein